MEILSVYYYFNVHFYTSVPQLLPLTSSPLLLHSCTIIVQATELNARLNLASKHVYIISLRFHFWLFLNFLLLCSSSIIRAMSYVAPKLCGAPRPPIIRRNKSIVNTLRTDVEIWISNCCFIWFLGREAT